MKEEVRNINVDLIDATKDNPRQVFDPKGIEELAGTFAASHGVMQPIIVRPIEYNRFEIIDGERRYRAAQLRGDQYIRSIIRN